MMCCNFISCCGVKEKDVHGCYSIYKLFRTFDIYRVLVLYLSIELPHDATPKPSHVESYVIGFTNFTAEVVL